MAAVPRAEFVPAEHRHEATDDHPLPIGAGQTISQPYIVAWMTQELGVAHGMRVLEIGTGSGYQTAILLELGAEVFSLELVPELAAQAPETLTRLGYVVASPPANRIGYGGWPDAAPFDRILLTASPPELPQTLVDQLADPAGSSRRSARDWQQIVVVDKRDGVIRRRETIAVRFVPMK